MFVVSLEKSPNTSPISVRSIGVVSPSKSILIVVTPDEVSKVIAEAESLQFWLQTVSTKMEVESQVQIPSTVDLVPVPPSQASVQSSISTQLPSVPLV